MDDYFLKILELKRSIRLILMVVYFINMVRGQQLKFQIMAPSIYTCIIILQYTILNYQSMFQPKIVCYILMVIIVYLYYSNNALIRDLDKSNYIISNIYSNVGLCHEQCEKRVKIQLKYQQQQMQKLREENIYFRQADIDAVVNIDNLQKELQQTKRTMSLYDQLLKQYERKEDKCSDKLYMCQHNYNHCTRKMIEIQSRGY